MNAGKSKVIVGSSDGKSIVMDSVVFVGEECRQTLLSA